MLFLFFFSNTDVLSGCQSDPSSPRTFLKVELNLSHACIKDIEPTPSALLCCVLQALAIQGELQNKIKLFSKCKYHC